MKQKYANVIPVNTSTADITAITIPTTLIFLGPVNMLHVFRLKAVEIIGLLG